MEINDHLSTIDFSNFSYEYICETLYSLKNIRNIVQYYLVPVPMFGYTFNYETINQVTDSILFLKLVLLDHEYKNNVDNSN